MNEVIHMLKDEMELIGNKESKKGQEYREILGIESLNEKELIKYKFDFIAKYFSKADFHTIEKRDYFLYVAKTCLSKDSMRYFDVNSINCVDIDKSLKTFCPITDKETQERIIYCIQEGEPISKVTQEFINQKLEEGMHPLSEKIEVLETLKGKSKQVYMGQVSLTPTQILGQKTINEPVKNCDKHYNQVKKDIKQNEKDSSKQI